MAQKIVGIVHEPLFQAFIDVRKACDYLDRMRSMEILRGYGPDTNLQRLIQRYWYGQKVVPKSGKCFGRPFHMERGGTQGDPVYQTIFNIIVYSVVRVVLLEVCVPQEAQHGIGWLEDDQKNCFYADDGRIAGQNLLWVQTTLMAMVSMFERLGLHTNLGNTKSVACTSGFIWGQKGASAYKKRVTDEGGGGWDRKQTKIICTECGGTMSAYYLHHHMDISNGIVMPQTRGVEVRG